MNIRQATLYDYEQIHKVRMAVQENKLSDPARVTYEHYKTMLGDNGRGWVCEMADKVVGFAIVDIKRANVWALFVLPAHEGRGIGKALHDEMVRWTFSEGGLSKISLSTDPGTRAEAFYLKAGWQPKGIEDGEQHFELKAKEWNSTVT